MFEIEKGFKNKLCYYVIQSLNISQMNNPKSRFQLLSEEKEVKNPTIEPKEISKNKRFNFTGEELQVTKNRQEEPSRSGGGRSSFRDRIQFEREQRAKTELAKIERTKIELLRSLTDASSFPELSNKPIEKETKNVINFLEKVLWIQPEEKKADEWHDGLTILEPEKSWKKREYVRRPNTPHEIMTRQVEIYETWKANYIRDYGEDYYEKYYRFQDWDYDYFDRLNEQDFEEMEYMERQEQEKIDEMSAEYNCHNYYENQFDD